MNSRIVISIPIALNNRQAVAAALESRYGTDYVFIGRVFRSTITPDSCQIEMSDRDDESTSTFELTEDRISATTLQQLETHQQIIYLTSNSGYGIGKKDKYCDENSPLNPVSLYGRTKNDAERFGANI